MSSLKIQFIRISVLLWMAVNCFAQPTPVLPGYSVSLFASGLSSPTGLVFRPAHQDLLVCQENGNKVSSIDLGTGVVSAFGVVAYPEHIAIDLKGNVYVTTDNDNGPLAILDSTGRTADAFLVPGHPDGLAVDSHDNVYLANNTTKVIVEYSAGGGLTNPTTYASGFQSQQGITFDKFGRLFAEDYAAGTVYYATPSGNTVWATGLGSVTTLPMGDIAYVPDLGLLVAQFEGPISQIPSKGIVNTFATGFSNPHGIAVDANQNIYIADAGTGSVWKFSAVAQ
jgi:sugar lactone lactonase YvrE